MAVDRSSVWMNDWLYETSFPAVRVGAELTKSLPGVEQVIVMPDSSPTIDFGFPNGVVLHSKLSSAYVFPGAIGDPNCGFRVFALDMKAGDLPDRELRNFGWRFINRLLELGADGELFPLDLDRVWLEGADYPRSVLGISDGGGITEDGGRVAIEPVELPPSIVRASKTDFFKHLHYGHFIEVDYVEHLWEPDKLEEHGLFPGQLVGIIHGGAARAGVELLLHYHEAITLEAIRSGTADEHTALSGMAGIPLDTPLGREYYNAVQMMQNYAYAKRVVAQYIVLQAFKDVFGAAPAVRLLSDRPHTKLEVIRNSCGESILVHRHGAQVLDSGLGVICSRPAVPNILVSGISNSHTAYCPHGCGHSPYLRKSMSLEDWRRLNAAPEVALTNGLRCMLDALADDPMTLHLAYQNVLDAADSIKRLEVIDKVARLWQVFNLTGTPKMLAESAMENP